MTMSCYPLQVVSRMVMNRSGEVFYIGGNDVLPAPLEPKREAFILQKLGTGQEVIDILHKFLCCCIGIGIADDQRGYVLSEHSL